MELTKVGMNPGLNAAMAHKPSMAQSVSYTSPTAPRFGADEAPQSRGFFSLVKRMWNRMLGKAHEAEDKKLAKDPNWALDQARRDLNTQYRKHVEALKGIIARSNVEVQNLKEAVTLEEKEKREALAAAKAMQSLATDHAEYLDQKEYAERQAQEWQDAKKAREEQEARVEQYQQEADGVKLQMQELETQMREADRRLVEAKNMVAKTQANNELQELQRQRDALLGQGVGLDGGTGELLESIRLEYEKSQISDSGAGREERLRELRARQRAKQVEKESAMSTALSELLAEENNQTQSQSASQSSTSGNPVDKDVDPNKK